MLFLGFKDDYFGKLNRLTFPKLPSAGIKYKDRKADMREKWRGSEPASGGRPRDNRQVIVRDRVEVLKKKSLIKLALMFFSPEKVNSQLIFPNELLQLTDTKVGPKFRSLEAVTPRLNQLIGRKHHRHPSIHRQLGRQNQYTRLVYIYREGPLGVECHGWKELCVCQAANQLVSRSGRGMTSPLMGYPR